MGNTPTVAGKSLSQYYTNGRTVAYSLRREKKTTIQRGVIFFSEVNILRKTPHYYQ
jgi:hypothetical protein